MTVKITDYREDAKKGDGKTQRSHAGGEIFPARNRGLAPSGGTFERVDAVGARG
jgi:hypothetical protein